MSLADALFWLHGFVIVAAMLAGLTTRSSERTSVAWFLVGSSALVGVFVLLGAFVIAIAHLLFCAGFGLLLFFVIDAVEEPTGEASGSDVSHWLVVLLGLGGAVFLATTVIGLVPETRGAAGEGLAAVTFADVGRTVLVDNGLATMATGLVLLAATLGAGFLARRGLD
ncbi:MAG: hypothetical protein GY944_24730 [bacterium]|nr:hypothetical protein [bacterium]